VEWHEAREILRIFIPSYVTTAGMETFHERHERERERERERSCAKISFHISSQALIGI